MVFQGDVYSIWAHTRAVMEKEDKHFESNRIVLNLEENVVSVMIKTEFRTL